MTKHPHCITCWSHLIATTKPPSGGIFFAHSKLRKTAYLK